jgi:hypothetical protein
MSATRRRVPPAARVRTTHPDVRLGVVGLPLAELRREVVRRADDGSREVRLRPEDACNAEVDEPAGVQENRRHRVSIGEAERRKRPIARRVKQRGRLDTARSPRAALT